MRTLTLAGLARRQLTARWMSFVPTAVGLGVALALASAVSLTQSRTEEAGLQQTVSRLGSQGLVSVHLTGVTDQQSYQAFTAEVRRAARDDMGGIIAPRQTGLISGGYVPQLINGTKPVAPGADFRIAASEDLPAHAALVAGAWPSGAASGMLEVTLPEAFVSFVRLGVGDVVCAKVQDGDDVVCLRIVGIWRPFQLQEAYWGPNRAPEVAAYMDVQSYFAMLKRQTNPATGALHASVISVASA
ncbi:MAG TPA: hypothetical protein VHJ99_04355, partial [Candidatus Dormibacteraeota bacterium]|nr:hypothetical protein [Candidatus Dormibacteraeota bacterium]